jgi:hypothetical protein
MTQAIAAKPVTSCAGPTGTSSPTCSSQPPDGTAPAAPSTPRPAGTRPAGTCTRTPSNPPTKSPAYSSQTPAAISRLTVEHLDTTDQLRLRFGREPLVLPEPISELVRTLAGTRRGHAALGDQGISPWLFPGGQPGRPISAYQLAQRLRKIGIRPAQARSTARFSLAAELPAAILARLLGIHIKVAIQWQHAAAGDWTTYAAHYSRRANTSTASREQPQTAPHLKQTPTV